MYERNEGVVFALANQVFYWEHDWLPNCEEPQVICKRPRDVTGFTFYGNILMDSCYDGKVRETSGGAIHLKYPKCAVLGINAPEGQLLEEVRRMADPEKIKALPLLATVYSDDCTVDVMLDYARIQSNRKCRAGKAQSLITNGQYYWANDGFVYKGFDKSQVRRQLGGDFVQLIPLPGGDFLYCWHSRNGIEKLHIIDNAEKRIIWELDKEKYGYFYCAGFYQWGEDYYMLMAFSQACYEATKEWRVYTIKTTDFKKKKELIHIATIEATDKPQYGHDNPFLADARLVDYFK